MKKEVPEAILLEEFEVIELDDGDLEDVGGGINFFCPPGAVCNFFCFPTQKERPDSLALNPGSVQNPSSTMISG